MAVDHHNRVHLRDEEELPTGHYSLRADEIDRQAPLADELMAGTPTGHVVLSPDLVRYDPGGQPGGTETEIF
jgi:hypothetical protein